VKADISRIKWVIGDGLRFRNDRRRATEVAVAMDALNRMLELRSPEYVLLAAVKKRAYPARPFSGVAEFGFGRRVCSDAA